MEKICWQITVAAFMQPLQYDLWSPAAKDNSITHAAKRGSNTCNPIYIAGTILQLQSAMEVHRQLIHQQHLQCYLHCGKHPTVANHNGIPSTTHPAAPLAIPFTLREQSCSCKSQWNSVDHTCTKNTWHPIYNAEPIRAWSENDPNISEHDPTTHETVSHPSHSRGRSPRFGDALCMEKHRVSCICYLSKTHFVRDFLQNSIGNSSTSTTCNAIYIAGSIVANHNGIPSTTHPAAPLAIPFTLREQSCSCKSQWNSVDHTCTKNTWHPIYNAEPIRAWSENDPNISEHDPTTHETVSHPSHSRGRSPRFGDALCMEKHRVSCICYLSKTHFVRDFLQNSIGNSSTSTTCNAIYSEGTILLFLWLTVSLTNCFFD